MEVLIGGNMMVDNEKGRTLKAIQYYLDKLYRTAKFGGSISDMLPPDDLNDLDCIYNAGIASLNRAMLDSMSDTSINILNYFKYILYSEDMNIEDWFNGLKYGILYAFDGDVHGNVIDMIGFMINHADNTCDGYNIYNSSIQYVNLDFSNGWFSFKNKSRRIVMIKMSIDYLICYTDYNDYVYIGKIPVDAFESNELALEVLKYTADNIRKHTIILPKRSGLINERKYNQ